MAATGISTPGEALPGIPICPRLRAELERRVPDRSRGDCIHLTLRRRAGSLSSRRMIECRNPALYPTSCPRHASK
jgi:hypothetical protein